MKYPFFITSDYKYINKIAIAKDNSIFAISENELGLLMLRDFTDEDFNELQKELESGKLKFVSFDKDSREEEWNFDELPLTRVFFIEQNEELITNEELEKIVYSIDRNLRIKLVNDRPEVLTDSDVIIARDNAINEYKY